MHGCAHVHVHGYVCMCTGVCTCVCMSSGLLYPPLPLLSLQPHRPPPPLRPRCPCLEVPLSPLRGYSHGSSGKPAAQPRLPLCSFTVILPHLPRGRGTGGPCHSQSLTLTRSHGRCACVLTRGGRRQHPGLWVTEGVAAAGRAPDACSRETRSAVLAVVAFVMALTYDLGASRVSVPAASM